MTQTRKEARGHEGIAEKAQPIRSCRRGGRPRISSESAARFLRPPGAGLLGGALRRGERGGSMGGVGHHFLHSCFLCRKPLAGNRDIFMYRGNTPFCSEECRMAQMEADEAAEKTGKACARRLTHGAPPAREVEGPQECGNKVRAGSVLAM
ncbi:FCS-Like Zinc finger 3-like [Phragmites australis]|uniref:FCS-Like Zinc finger 3-like n=1 Tax=Phragmites australis TaxID=29695 RepID=UPI002D76EB87|nr:FCS-Like Zinc finger 3-like [Phragmites australis]